MWNHYRLQVSQWPLTPPGLLTCPHSHCKQAEQPLTASLFISYRTQQAEKTTVFLIICKSDLSSSLHRRIKVCPTRKSINQWYPHRIRFTVHISDAHWASTELHYILLTMRPHMCYQNGMFMFVKVRFPHSWTCDANTNPKLTRVRLTGAYSPP